MTSTPFPHAVPKGEAMSETPPYEQRSGENRRQHSSPFADPKLWVSFSAILLTIFLALFGYIATQLAQISATVQAVSLVTTKNETQIEQLKRELDQLRAEKQMLEARLIPLEKKTERLEAILTLNDRR